MEFSGPEDTWNNGHSAFSNSRVAFFRVYATNNDARTCSIKTYGSDERVANADYTDIQWLSAFSSPGGSESTVLPIIGAIGICIFLDGQPWIMGYFQPTTIDNETEIPDPELEGNDPVAASAATNKEKLNDGDSILRSLAGSKVIVRAGGEIEIESTKACKRTYFPTRNTISEISSNFEQDTDGGYIKWTHFSQDTDETNCTQLWRSDVNQTQLIIDEKGTVELNSDILWRYRTGALADFDVTKLGRERILEQIKVDGSREYYLRQPDSNSDANAYETKMFTDGEYYRGINDFGYYESIQPTGEYRVNINNNWQYTVMADGETTIDIGIAEEKKELMPGEGGEAKFTLNVKPTGELALKINKKAELSIKDTGETKLDIGPGKAKVEIQASGETTIDVKGNMIAITPGGEVTVTATTKITLDAPQIILGKQGSPITTVNSHLGVVDLITGVPVVPSVSTFGDI